MGSVEILQRGNITLTKMRDQSDVWNKSASVVVCSCDDGAREMEETDAV